MENWIHWLGPLHPVVIHFPIVLPLLALLALAVDFYRPKPWLSQATALLWVMTFLAGIASLLTGHALALHFGIVPQWSWIPPESALKGQLRDHALWGSISLFISFLILAAAWKILTQRPWPLLVNLTLGLVLAVSFGVTGHEGGEMVYGFNQESAPINNAGPIGSPLEALGNFHKTMIKMNVRPWNSRTHGHRWVNTYASPEAVAAYQATNPLPVGSLVVLESFEDENNQPSGTPGPLYVLKKGTPADSPRTHGWLFAFTWDKPTPNNPEKLKDAIQWLPGDAHLSSCVKCHSHFKEEDYMGGIPEGFENR